MYLLSKLLPVFVLPVGVTIWLLVLGLWTKRRVFLGAALAVLWLFSTPAISGLIVRGVEGGQVRLPAADMPEVDAIVVLSGGRDVAPGSERVPEWTDSADRYFGGVSLYDAGRAPLLVFTGGVFSTRRDSPTEGDVLRSAAMADGVPDSSILVTRRVRNTAAEAAAVAEVLADSARILLVTSAFHMPRSVWLFERAGMRVVAFSVDYRGDYDPIEIRDFFPTGEALSQSDLGLRELYGRAFYAVFRGAG